MIVLSLFSDRLQGAFGDFIRRSSQPAVEPYYERVMVRRNRYTSSPTYQTFDSLSLYQVG